MRLSRKKSKNVLELLFFLVVTSKTLPYKKVLGFSPISPVTGSFHPKHQTFQFHSQHKAVVPKSFRSTNNPYIEHDDEHDDEDDFSPIDFRIFLTQRSIQSFLFLLVQTRDPHTIKWLDTFLQSYLLISKPTHTTTQNSENKDGTESNDSATENAFGHTGWSTSVENDRNLSSELLYYHGISAFNTSAVTSWDEVFLRLLEEPDTTISVQSNNPTVPEFEIDIDPSRLCSRILSVRDQIAKEWAHDLRVISRMGEQMFQSYWDHVQKGDGVGFDRSSLMFLEFNPDPESDYKPSPLRKGNFDLLLRLTTQESICRVLQREDGIVIDDGDEDNFPKRMVNRKYLKEFYIERLYKCFKGNIGKYGRADDFFEELMLTPPRMILINQNVDDTYDSEDCEEECIALFVDPLGIAEMVVRERAKVALEWSDLINEVISKGSDQVDLRKQMLNRMMGIQ